MDRDEPVPLRVEGVLKMHDALSWLASAQTAELWVAEGGRGLTEPTSWSKRIWDEDKIRKLRLRKLLRTTPRQVQPRSEGRGAASVNGKSTESASKGVRRCRYMQCGHFRRRQNVL